MQIKKPFFRKESMKKISEPEQLNEYVKVISVPIWITLTAVIVLIVGAFIWASTAVMERKIPAVISVTEAGNIVYFSSDYLGLVDVGQVVQIDGTDKEYYIEDLNYTIVSELQCEVSGENNLNATWLYRGYIFTEDLEEGIYDATIILETKHPINYLFQ